MEKFYNYIATHMLMSPWALVLLPDEYIKNHVSDLTFIRPYNESFRGEYLYVGCEKRTLDEWLNTSQGEIRKKHGALAAKYLLILQYRIKNLWF